MAKVYLVEDCIEGRGSEEIVGIFSDLAKARAAAGRIPNLKRIFISEFELDSTEEGTIVDHPPGWKPA